MDEFTIEREDGGEYCTLLSIYRGWDDCETCGGLPNELVVEWFSGSGYDIRESYGCYGGNAGYEMSAEEAGLWALENLDQQDASWVIASIERFEGRRQSESPSASVGSGEEA